MNCGSPKIYHWIGGSQLPSCDVKRNDGNLEASSPSISETDLDFAINIKLFFKYIFFEYKFVKMWSETLIVRGIRGR